MVYCKLLKYIKLFYISVASFHASSTLVNDQHGKTIAFQNLMRSSDRLIDHRYTFLSNASYAKCFRDPREFTWLYKDTKAGFKVVSFSSSIASPKRRAAPPKPVFLTSPPPINLKPVSRSSIRPPRLQPHNDSSSSDDE